MRLAANARKMFPKTSRYDSTARDMENALEAEILAQDRARKARLNESIRPFKRVLRRTFVPSVALRNSTGNKTISNEKEKMLPLEMRKTKSHL